MMTTATLFGPDHDPAAVLAALEAAVEKSPTHAPVTLVIITPRRDTEVIHRGLHQTATTMGHLAFARHAQGCDPREAVHALEARLGFHLGDGTGVDPAPAWNPPSPGYRVRLMTPEDWEWDWDIENARGGHGTDPMGSVAGSLVVIDPGYPQDPEQEPIPRQGLSWDGGYGKRPAHPVKRAAMEAGQMPEHGVTREKRERYLSARKAATPPRWGRSAETHRDVMLQQIAADARELDGKITMEAGFAHVQDPEDLLSRVQGRYCPTTAESQLLFLLWKRRVLDAEQEELEREA